MFDIGIWCDDENLKAEINAQVEAFEDFRIQNETAHFDILIINISDENYSLAKISSILQEMNLAVLCNYLNLISCTHLLQLAFIFPQQMFTLCVRTKKLF